MRGFARYLHAIDPAHEVPPPGLLAVPRRRPTPYIYTTDQIAEVLLATRRLEPPLRALTYQTMLGLLAATGMRLGEAFALAEATSTSWRAWSRSGTPSSTGYGWSPASVGHR